MDILKLLLPIIAANVVVLVVMIIVIRKMLLSDTLKAVAKIRAVEGEVRKKEEAIRKEIAEHEKEFAQKKTEAEAQMQAERERGEKEVANIRDQVVGEAKKEAEKIIEQAKSNEEKFRNQLAQDMEEKTVEYSGQVFDLVFSDKVTPAIDQAFLTELLDALDEIDAGSITVDSDEAEFHTAREMDPEQKARLESILKEKFSADIKVEEQVDPELLAGVSFKLGSLEIDGSLRNRFSEAVAEVKKNARA
jgi:F0F1-type ATP synthase membrane subunit b/b'